MSARVIVVRHDAELARWEIGEHPWVGRAASPELSGTQVIESGGRVREIVIDAEQPSDSDLVAVRGAFGTEVAEIVRGHRTGGDLDIVVEVDDGAPADTRPATATTTVGHVEPLPGEPGRTVRDERAARTTADVTGHPAVVEVHRPEASVQRDGDEIVVTIRGLVVGDDVWVRLSAAESGSIVATARLRPRGDHTDTGASARRRPRTRSAVAEARMAYGLDLDPEHLHLTITDEPLAPVGTLADRRRRWCDQLLERSHRARWRHPGRAIADASSAADVAVALGDPVRHRRAASLETEIRRRRMVIRTVVAMMVLTAVAVTTWWIIADRSPDDSFADERPTTVPTPATSSPAPTTPTTTPATTSPTTTSPATNSPTTSPTITTTTTAVSPGASRLGFPGPTEYRFDNDEAITITVPGSNALDAGTTRLELTGRETFRELMDYSTPENCRASLSVPAAGTTGMFPAPMEIVVRLVPVGGDADDPRVTAFLGTVRFDADLVETSVFPETCGTVGDLGTGAWGEALFRRGPAAASLDLVEPLAPGLWELELVGIDGRPTTPTPEPIALRVVAAD